MDALAPFHPLVRDWFVGRFGTPTEPQIDGWPAIAAGRDTLIAAPTGSGKTLAAFLWCLDGLVRDARAGGLPDETRVLYVSPLKALSNDVQKNLDAPLAEIRALAEARGTPLPPIRTAVRTGDTSARDRQRAIARPPHLLITTPESLYLLLTSESGRRILSTVSTVIVDEIHAVARDKRGLHLALSLERLDRLVTRGGRERPVRIGLSATQRPIETIARLLVGTERAGGEADPPACAIVDGGHRREMDLAVEMPDDELGAVASKEQWAWIASRIAELAGEHRTTLVFVNTRRLAERVTHALGERLGEHQVAAHHGSLSRSRRLAAEEALKAARIRVCVATASLELGIDVGTVDLVVLIGSVRSFAVGLQRVGRAGHWRGAIPKARLFPTSRDELAELAAFLYGVRRDRLEVTRVPRNARDVLAQQIVAAAACEPLGEDELFALVRGAWPYADLPRETFDAVIAMLSEGVTTRRGRASAHLHRDAVNREVRGRRGARLAAITSGGAIPDNANYAVIADPDETLVGTIDEDFAIESMAGDVILLGNTSWRIRRVEAGRVRVEDAAGAAPTVPFWLGEAPGRSRELSEDVAALRAAIEPLLSDRAAAERWLMGECLLSLAAATQLAGYLAAAKEALGVLPTQDVLVAERFFDESGGMQLVVHAPFGSRINRAFGLALRKRFCRSFDFELQAAATDDAVLLSIGPQHSFPLESIFDFVQPHEAEEILVQAALQAPVFGVRFRWNATRALAVLRFSGGRKTPPPLLRMRSDDLLASVFPAQVACQDNAPGGPIEVPDHPLCHETVEDCLREWMDVDGLVALLTRIAGRDVRLVARDVPEPSPLAYEVVNARPYAFLDDAPLEERRARAVATRRVAPRDADGLGALDPEAIDTVVGQVWPDPRDAHELHDALLGLVALPEADLAAEWRPWLHELVTARRAARLEPAGVWVAAERLATALAAYEGSHPVAASAPVAAVPAPVAAGVPPAEDPVLALVRGWMEVCGPTTVSELATRLGLPRWAVEAAMAGLEAEGLVLRGTFRGTSAVPGETEWCERRLLARIHRLTLGRLRREIAPVTPADFLRFLARWQRVHPGTQAHGADGVAAVVAQLQGLQLPAAAWEDHVLPARVAGYQPGLLDHLCATGVVTWGRVCPAAEGDGRRRPPGRSAPVALFLRDDAPVLLGGAGPSGTDTVGPTAEGVLGLLERRGALFFGEIVRASGRPAGLVEETLWELVAAGRVTCDAFAGLRALLGSDRGAAARAGGRWSLLRGAPTATEAGPPPDVGGAAPPALAVVDGDDPRLERLVDVLLRRWGVLFRDLLARETRPPPWRELLPLLRRREARGLLRGGRFVSGFVGEQFALPEAVDALRSVRRAEPRGDEVVTVAAADPLNLVGVLTPGARVPAVLGGRVSYRDGVPVPEPADAAG